MTRRFGSGRSMASPVTASITVVRSMSPGLNFMPETRITSPYRVPSLFAEATEPGSTIGERAPASLAGLLRRAGT
jgi:hypothetical protein